MNKNECLSNVYLREMYLNDKVIHFDFRCKTQMTKL